MTTDLAFERLRAANPAPAEQLAGEALFASIVSRPADPRLAAPRRARWRVAAVAVAALAVGVATAWAAESGVRQLFASNPAAGEPATALWHQVAVPSTIARAGSLSIPRFGTVELWVAETEQGGWCGAIRLPGGAWAANGKESGESAGGTAPGCYPSRRQVNAAGSAPVFVISGLDYYEVDVDARGHGGGFWRVVYGVSEVGKPARVVDTVSGREAPVLHGRFFAIAVADAHPESPSPTRLFHLVAYDGRGRVLADADKPLP